MKKPNSSLLFVIRCQIFATLVLSAASASFVSFGCCSTAVSQQSADASRKKLAETRQAYQAQIEKLAADCKKNSQLQVLSALDKFRVVYPSDRQTLFPLDASSFVLPTDQDQDAKAWAALRDLNRDTANALFEIAKSLAKVDPASAYQLLHEILALNPEHAEARRILGFKLNSKNQWVRPSRKITASKATTKHSIVGWPARQYLYVNSGHYRIATTADQETAIRLANKLERWHNLWRQLFVNYWAKPGTIARWFEGKSNERTSTRKHKVVFFASRDEYIRTLSDLGVQGVEDSTGYYNDNRKTMFFYAGADDDLRIRATWLQEQAHQLFQETGTTKKNAIEDSGIWAVEAIAMYFESMTEFERFATFGGFEAQRLQYARTRVNRQGFYLPLNQLVKLGRQSFQTHAELRSLYSQSAGLAHYLMMAENGKYRDAFIEYIGLVYQKRTKPDSLVELTGLSFERMDQNYRSFLVPKPDDLASLSQPKMRTELALGASPVTNDQLKQVSQCKNLIWLQLSGTRIDDDCAATIAKLVNLQQLFVDSTAVTDKFLETVSQLNDLEELDVAGTAITDRGLAEIAKLKKLKVLYLTGTKISDEGLAQLETLTDLEYLDVAKTLVTTDALKALKSKLPKLK